MSCYIPICVVCFIAYMRLNVGNSLLTSTLYEAYKGALARTSNTCIWILCIPSSSLALHWPVRIFIAFSCGILQKKVALSCSSQRTVAKSSQTNAHLYSSILHTYMCALQKYFFGLFCIYMYASNIIEQLHCYALFFSFTLWYIYIVSACDISFTRRILILC